MKNQRDTAIELGVSENTLRKWVALGAPCVIINPEAPPRGLRRRYDPAAVKAWLEKWSAAKLEEQKGKGLEA